MSAPLKSRLKVPFGRQQGNWHARFAVANFETILESRQTGFSKTKTETMRDLKKVKSSSLKLAICLQCFYFHE